MNLAELKRQIRGVRSMITVLTNKYKYDGGYRIEREIEKVKGVHVLAPPYMNQDTDCTEEQLKLLLFLLDEEKRMVKALSKCYNRIVENGTCPYDEEWYEDNPFGYVAGGILKRLCQKPDVQKRVQKAVGGYDVIITQTSRIDRELLNAIYRRISQGDDEVRDTMDRIGHMETDYESAIDYTQDVKDCLNELKEMGGAGRMKDIKNELKQCESISISVDKAFRYIRKYAEAADEMKREIERNQESLYHVYAVDGRVLTSEEAAVYDRKEAHSCIDVLHRTKLLVHVTEELTRLRRLVSAALGEAGIAYSYTMEDPCAASASIDNRITKCMVKLSLCDRVTTKHNTQTTVHMSKSGKRITYQYPVIQTRRLLVNRKYAAELAARIKECAEREQKQMEQIFIDYEPKYDIHTDWHSWEADEGVASPDVAQHDQEKMITQDEINWLLGR